MKRDEFIKKLHPAITHVNASDNMSEETVEAINIMVEKVFKMTTEEIKKFVEDEYKKRIQKDCKHKWTYLCGTPQNETHKCVYCGLIA